MVAFEYDCMQVTRDSSDHGVALAHTIVLVAAACTAAPIRIHQWRRHFAVLSTLRRPIQVLHNSSLSVIINFC